ALASPRDEHRDEDQAGKGAGPGRTAHDDDAPASSGTLTRGVPERGERRSGAAALVRQRPDPVPHLGRLTLVHALAPFPRAPLAGGACPARSAPARYRARSRASSRPRPASDRAETPASGPLSGG